MTISPSSGPPEGRELDAMIAEKWMGFTWRRVPRHGVSLKGLIPPDEMLAWSDLLGDEAVARDYVRFCPHYSTDIAAAWLVVEKMRADGWGFVFNSVGDHGARAFFTKGERFFGEDADALPHAICLAALAASVPTGEEPK